MLSSRERSSFDNLQMCCQQNTHNSYRRQLARRLPICHLPVVLCSVTIQRTLVTCRRSVAIFVGGLIFLHGHFQRKSQPTRSACCISLGQTRRGPRRAAFRGFRRGHFVNLSDNTGFRRNIWAPLVNVISALNITLAFH